MIKNKGLLSLLAITLAIPLFTSCNPNSTSTSIPDINSETSSIVEQVETKITLSFNSEGGTVSYIEGTYHIGDIINIIINPNKGYNIAKVSVNNERIRPTKDSYKYKISSKTTDICVVFEKNQVIMSDFQFELNDETNTAKIIKYTPDRSIVPYPFEIPEEVNISNKAYKITGIAKEAFYSSSVEKIILSKNIVDIALETFANVHGLTSIEVNPANDKFASFDDCLYSKDFKSLIAIPCEYKNTTITFKDGVNVIEESAALNNRLIQVVNVPSSVTALKNQAFASMHSLKQMNLSSNIKEIPFKCFANCVELEEINIPEGIVKLGDYSFNFCPDLKKVGLPNSLKEIGKEAFYHDEKLTDIKLNEGLEVIGKSAFGSNISLKEVILPSTLLRLEDAAFETCRGLKTVQLNEGLKYLGGAVFILTPYIKEVVIPSSVEEIHYNPFIGTGAGILKLAEGNKNYKMVDGVLYNADMSELICFPYSVTTSDNSFRIPDSVTKLGYNCFSMNIYLKKVIIPVSVTSMYCSFQEILPSEASFMYELEIHYEGTKEQFKQIDHGDMKWNYKANFKDNRLYCSDGVMILSPEFE